MARGLFSILHPHIDRWIFVESAASQKATSFFLNDSIANSASFPPDNATWLHESAN